MKRVLSIDGGGMRGLIPAVVCRKFEEWSGSPVRNLFDLVAGSSTGGIIALGLSRPPSGMPASELVDFYVKYGKKIFSAPRSSLSGLFRPKYSSANLAEVAAATFGGAKLSEAAIEVLVTAYDIELRRPIYLNSSQAKGNTKDDFLMRDIAVATSAAPTFFPPATLGKTTVIDGGIVANNPSLAAYSHAKSLWPDEKIFMVSLGTGTAGLPIKPASAKKWGALQWISPLIDSLFDGTAHTADDFFRHTQLDTYRRFQCSLSEVTRQLDGVGEVSVKGLEQLGESIAMLAEGEIRGILRTLQDAGRQLSARIERPLRGERVKLKQCAVDGTITNYRDEILYLFTGWTRFWPSQRIVPVDGRWQGSVDVGDQEAGARITLVAVSPQLAAYIELYLSDVPKFQLAGMNIPDFPRVLDQIEVYLDHRRP